jgi:transcriptional regulator with XRE-family HTH domain
MGSFGSPHFAGRLKSLREAAGLTQAQLAEQAGMNQFGIAKLEQGQREPSWNTVLALAKALDVDCRAFAEEGSARAKQGPGRPPKPTTQEKSAPKRPRGRPRKTA